MVDVELTLQLRDLMKVVRQLKQQREGLRPGMPAGMVGILLTIDQLAARDDRDCHAKDLAHVAGLDQSTVSRAVAALVSQGLVERVPDPADRRASILAVTGVGREALQHAQEWFEGVLARALEQWREDEIDALTVSLGRFVADLDAALRGEAPRTEAPRTEAPKNEKPQTETLRTEKPHSEKSRPEAPRTEESRPDAPRTEESRPEAPRTEESRPEAPRAQKSHRDKQDNEKIMEIMR